MIYLTRRYRFSAAHRLYSERLSEAENERVYGKCANPGGHGHNYALEVTVAGEPDPVTGMVVDLASLDGFVEKEIRVPTTENVCITVYRRLQDGFHHARVAGVRLEETSLNSFTYRGEQGCAAS
jgi:6-pyruvoyltetrahydropterin/6-carboxytetrahydropterin synthase